MRRGIVDVLGKGAYGGFAGFAGFAPTAMPTQCGAICCVLIGGLRGLHRLHQAYTRFRGGVSKKNGPQ